MSRLEELKLRHQRELEALRKEQANCNHIWRRAEYDPEIINEPVYETRFQGSDCYPELVSTKLKKVDRWSRTCKICGKVEYTKDRVAIKYEPKFD